jgi:hypothetical protein
MTKLMSVASPAWTLSEDDELRILALSGATMSEISKRMNRTSSAIRHRALRLKIVIVKSTNRGRQPGAASWKPGDDDRLRALAAGGESSSAIAELLGRDPSSVRKRAIKLGVKLAGSRNSIELKASMK